MGDWDRKPKAAPGVWLKLKAKDEQVRIRIAASPYREVQIWPEEKGQRIDAKIVNSFTPGQWISVMRNPDWNVSELYHLMVIDRADGQAKIFQASGAIYGKIREYATNPEWGNPTNYDITIKRTEKPGSYYDITPSPNKSDLLINELNLIDAIKDKLPESALLASEAQPDDIDENVPPEPLPWEPAAYQQGLTSNPIPQVQPTLPNDDIVITDLGDGPINLDDIPF